MKKSFSKSLKFCCSTSPHNLKKLFGTTLPIFRIGFRLDRLFLVFLGVIFQHSTEKPPSLPAFRQIYELEVENGEKRNIVVI